MKEYNVTLSDKDMWFLLDLLEKRIDYGGTVPIMKDCIRLYDFFLKKYEKNNING